MHAIRLGDDAAQTIRYEEVLRVPALSVGRYVLPAGSVDPQQPHTEDEIYLVRSGRGILRTPAGEAAAVPGAVLFVPAGEEHRFVDIEEPLDVIVVFGPAEYTNKKEDG